MSFLPLIAATIFFFFSFSHAACIEEEKGVSKKILIEGKKGRSKSTIEEQVVERDTVDRLYRLDGVSHVAANINAKRIQCITSIRRQQNMVLHGRVIPYLEAAGLYQVALLNNYWFKVD
ncbi:hypothetical protein PIB30_044570 [Stylosanthes scabra]|uniref:Uncharacterized protein n=1 Tax=Stylosanthes scabra TaxID=79078 RepID=A0ABU6WDY1_9FABA|nr:hypothetical protein [Stylosanthes scabra]